MGLFDQFKDGAKETGSGLGKILGASGKTLMKVGAITLKGSVAAAKWAGNAALDAVCTSSENSELKYRYDGDVGNCRYGCRKVLGKALVDLALKRSRDSYLKDILSRCSGVDLSGPQGTILYAVARDRSLCKRILQDDKEAIQKVKGSIVNDSLTEEHIIDAAMRIDDLLSRRNDYSSFVREVFVVSVGEDIEEFVYDDDGKILRDANGNSVTEVVGINHSVAVFKVTFSCGLKIKFKVYLNNGSWEGLEHHHYI